MRRPTGDRSSPRHSGGDAVGGGAILTHTHGGRSARLAGGGYLLWYARSRERRRREPVAIVGAFLVLMSVFLVYVAWRSAHPTLVPKRGSRHARMVRYAA
jgi:hypothetical protein